VNDLNAAADLLSTTLQALAQARNLAYIDPRQAFIGHGACDGVEWINGLSLGTVPNSYHPKAVGHSSGFGPVVLSGVQGIPNTDITQGPASQSNTASPQFEFTSAPAAAGFQCRLDGGAFSACSSPKQYTGLSQGSHTVQVRGVNAAGNVDQFPDVHTWTVDTVAPALTLDPGGPTGTVATAAAAFTFSGETGATLSCRIDGGSFESCSSPRNYTDLPDGAHTFTVRATDAAGNPTTASRSWTVDTTAPVATVNAGPGNPTASDDATIEFSLDDPGAGAECRLDSDDEEDFDPCNSPVELLDLPAGPHTFEVRAADTVGNVGPVASFEWEVDLDAPTVTVTSGPPALTNQDDAELSFDFEAGSTTVCSLDGGDPEPCASPVTYGDLEDGEHSFVVQATDSASHVATDTYSWIVDTDAPPAAIESGPPALTGSTSSEIAFSSEDPGAEFECRLDSEEELEFQPCASPDTRFALGDGPHELEVRAVDAAGNAGPPASHAWTVDTTGPVATIGAAPAAAVAQNTAQFGFTSNEPGSSFSCRIDSGDFQPCSAPQDYSGLGDGPHSFEVKATDAVGNTGPVDSHSWSIDTVAPAVTFDDGPAFTEIEKIVASASANFNFHASEPGSSFQCRIDSGQPGDFFGCNSPRSYSGLSDGPHTLEVRATDSLGNQGPAAAYAWNSDTVTPTATINTGPTGQVVANSATFTFSANEPGDFECRIDSGPYEACASSATYENLDDGGHTFHLRFTDAGDRQSTASRSWTIDTEPPAVSISGGPSGTVTSSLAGFTFSAAGGGTPQCKWDNESFAACPSATSASRSGLADGPHTFEVKSTDVAGNVGSATRTWIVDRTPPQTNLVSGPPATTSTGDATLTFSADDPDAGFQCSLDGAVFATCSSPQSYSGLGNGDHTFRVRATDQVGNTDLSPATAAWRVEPPPTGAVQGETGKKPKCSKKGKKKKRKGARKCKRSR
jgi:hypothetical protein